MNKHIPLWGAFLSLILIACGDLGWDMVIPSAGTYQVSALVNEVSLDTCSVVGQGNDFYPYFKNSLVNDPDVRGLVVFLENSQGEKVSREYHYSLFAESKGESESGEADISVSGVNPDESAETLSEDAPEKKAPVEFIRVPRLDQQLPAFVLPEGLPIGYYTIVFQVLGEKDILSRTEKSIYYLADAEFDLTDLQSYLPGALAGAHLASPGENVLLEALISADERLSPYVVWYSGKQSIGEGYVTEGANRFMWQVPEQPLFHTIRVEVFPMMPESRLRRGIIGKTKELLLPVSTKNERKRNFSEEADPFTHWYDFAGTLHNVKNPEKANDLTPLETTVPVWMPYAGMYGLSIGPGDLYALPVAFTALNPNEQGQGRIKLQFAPLGKGTILDLFFNLKDSPNTLHINVSLAETGLVLSLELGKERYETILELTDRENYISLLFDYQVGNSYVKAGLSLNNTAVFLEPDLSELSSLITGTGTLQLGSVLSVTPDVTVNDTEKEADEETEPKREVTVVIVELKTVYDISSLQWEGEGSEEKTVATVVPPETSASPQTKDNGTPQSEG
ncbi:MAG: hypothetical protein LBB78_06465 [Spirochaetaceae bacterium]|jgi:hypothetical protein|nr:hypothetical protein [Spirochaetaceae bacterium]